MLACMRRASVFCAVQVLSWDPRVFLHRDFLTPGEQQPAAVGDPQVSATPAGLQLQRRPQAISRSQTQSRLTQQRSMVHRIHHVAPSRHAVTPTAACRCRLHACTHVCTCFVSRAEEAEHMVAKAAPRLQPSIVTAPDTAEPVLDTRRTSSGMFFNRRYI